MSYSISIPIKTLHEFHRYQAIERETVRFYGDGWFCEGVLALRDIVFDQTHGMVLRLHLCRDWREREPLIRIPLTGDVRISYNAQDDPDARVDIRYGMDGKVYYSTPASREAYRKSAGLRYRKERLTLCVASNCYYDEGDYSLCLHPPERHGHEGCMETIYDDWGSHRCGCECYTKPAPLATIGRCDVCEDDCDNECVIPCCPYCKATYTVVY